MFCEQFTSFIFAFPLSPSLLLLVLCVGVVLIVIYSFSSHLFIYCTVAQVCAAHCATLLSSSRCSSLLLLLCTHSSSRANYIIRHFYFYSDFKKEREGEGERGTGASAELNLFGVCSSAVDVIVDETFLWLTPLSGVASLLLSFLFLSLPALDRRQLALSPSSPPPLPSFCCPCIVSFSNQFVLC